MELNLETICQSGGVEAAGCFMSNVLRRLSLSIATIPFQDDVLPMNSVNRFRKHRIDNISDRRSGVANSCV
jgi:hypothetical protein